LCVVCGMSIACRIGLAWRLCTRLNRINSLHRFNHNHVRLLHRMTNFKRQK